MHILIILGCKFPEIADKGDGGNFGLFLGGKLTDDDMVFSFSEEYLPNGLHDLSDFDALGTADVARQAGRAGPYGIGSQKLFFEAELGKPDDLIGQDIHLGDGRTSRRALPALVAGKEVLPAEFLDFGDKIILDFFLRNANSHQEFPSLFSYECTILDGLFHRKK